MKSDDAERIARTLIGLLQSKAKTRDQRLGILQDLAWKIRDIPLNLRANYLSQATKHFEDGEIDSILKLVLRPASEANRSSISGIHHVVDVAILTARQYELKAVLKVFGIKRTTQKPDLVERGRLYWRCTLPAGSARVSCAISSVGEPRNVPAALATSDMIRIFQPRLCIMVGIAGGLRTKVKRGDVVLPRRILDYEHVRLLVSKSKKPSPGFFQGLDRPAQFQCHKDVVGLLDALSIDSASWKSELIKLSSDLGVRSKLIEKWSPSLHDGVMLAGEKLIANGKLGDMRLRHHEQIRGVDQEDSGFAQACDAESNYRVNWAVARGIADYADPVKRKSDPTQAVAAASAAIIARELCITFAAGRRRAASDGVLISRSDRKEPD